MEAPRLEPRPRRRRIRAASDSSEVGDGWLTICEDHVVTDFGRIFGLRHWRARPSGRAQRMRRGRLVIFSLSDPGSFGWSLRLERRH